MSRRIEEKRANQAKKLQRKVDDLVERRGNLLRSAASEHDFQSRADIWKAVHKLEVYIETLSRLIRRLQTPTRSQTSQPMLWDFVQPEPTGKPSKKGGR